MNTTENTSDWSLLSWPEILEIVETGPRAVILPVGATEQHGPHLGTGVDFIIAEKVAAEVGLRCHIPVLPALHYGCSIAHSHRWPGTIALTPTTMIAVLMDIGEWLYNAGFRKLFIVNCHVGNFASLRCALDMLRAKYEGFQIALFNDGNLNPELKKAFTWDADDWHANAAETSLMLALAPEGVKKGRIAQADDPDRTPELVFSYPVNATSTNGVTGKPSAGSKAEGRKLFEQVVEFICEQVMRGLDEKAPVSNTYNSRVAR